MTFSTSLYITPYGWQYSVALKLSKQQYESSGAVEWVSFKMIIEFMRLSSVIFAVYFMKT